MGMEHTFPRYVRQVCKNGAVPRTQRDRTAETTTKLIAAARTVFANQGYAAALLDDVVQAAGVTKGALYHHFPNKLELFAAVYEQEQQRLAELSMTAHSARPDEDGLVAGLRAFLEASRDPGVQRITLIDAPSVLGWERLRDIENRYTIAQLRVGIELAVATGLIDERPVEPLVQMLNGALCEASMMIARSDNQRETTEQVVRELRVWLDALRRQPGRQKSGRAGRAQ